ncbi:GNAT family N-acetyltransferase [bacterium]|nr:GNAT family N-acetyltransferase [bacterium]MBT5015844.1 GNAT family N-acetyltransferase [bacterium]
MKINLILFLLLGVSTIIQPLSFSKFSFLGGQSQPSSRGPVIVDYDKAKHFMYLMRTCHENCWALGECAGQPGAHPLITCQKFREDAADQESPAVTIKVLETDSKPQGFISFASFPENPLATVSDLCISEGARSQGFGSMLLRHTEKILSSTAGVQTIVIPVVKGQKRAIAFYRKHGYLYTGTNIGQNPLFAKKNIAKI